MGDVPLTSEVRTLARLAWPVVLGQLGLVSMGVVDLMVVGSLGEAPLAAVGLGNTWSFAGLIVGLGVASGLDPFVATAYGAGDPKRAGRAALHGSVLLLGIAVAIAVQHLLAAPALTALGQPAHVIPDAHAYSVINVVGILPFLGFTVVRQVLQGGGIMRPAMWVVWGGNLVNLVADVVLVWRLDLGVAGAAWATVIVRWVMFLALLFVGRHVLREAWPGLVWSRELFARVARKASPVGLQVGFEVWAFNGASFLAGMLGSTQVAAHTAALSAASMAFMVPMGIGAAGATRVGNLRGAGKPWERSAWTAIAMGAGVMLLSGAIFLFAPHLVARVFTTDPPVVAAILSVLPYAAAFGLFDGTQAVAMGVLRGLGDTRGPAVIALVAYWVVALPWGVWAMRTRGLEGIWEGLTAGLALAAVLLVFRVARPAVDTS
ncbi:MAG: MATE family efflux transporter, partial [Myxococcales bacterium]|nr:MATE family efflux transporter [Myxococcales bacterium]